MLVPGCVIKELPLTMSEAFLLSRIDGYSTLETLLAVSGMSRLEAIRSVLDLVSRQVVALS